MKLLFLMFIVGIWHTYSKSNYWFSNIVLITTHLHSHLFNFKVKKFFFLESTLSLLTLWLSLVIVITVYEEVSQGPNALFFVLSGLSFIILAFFNSNNLLYFYIFFELSIVPIFLIILVWGYQSERLFASLSLLLYTFMASLPLLFILLVMNQSASSLGLSLMNINLMTLCQGSLSLVLIISFAFLVKTPMFLTHMWLPKAHVEAPVFGSMLLAAVLLKMGTFGFVLFSGSAQSNFFNFIIFSLSMWGMAAVALMCTKMTDMKILVAYSSVSHMAFLLALIILNTSTSILSGVLMMLTHGFTSSALFFSVNWMYQISHSRSTLFNKGVIFTTTYFFMWSGILMSNISAPPTINFIAEILGVFSIVKMSLTSIALVLIFMLATATYSYFMFSFSAQMKSDFLSTTNIWKKSYLILSLHLVPMGLFSLNMNIFM